MNGEHPAARGFAAWLDRRRFEYHAPEVDGGESIASLWQHWLLEVEHGSQHDELVEAVA